MTDAPPDEPDRAQRRRLDRQLAAKRKKRREMLVAGLHDSAKAAEQRIRLMHAINRAEEVKAEEQSARKKKPPKRTELEKVENPYGYGFDQIERVVDTIKVMTRRRQLSERQSRAAYHYREAFDTIRSGAMRGTLDPDKVGGGSSSGKVPSPAELFAAEVLNDAERLLGVVLRVVIEEIVGMGRSIEEAADMLCGKGERPATRMERLHIGHELRRGLDALADKWFTQPIKEGRIRMFRPDDARPSDEASEHRRFVEKGRSVHATARFVYEAGKKKRV